MIGFRKVGRVSGTYNAAHAMALLPIADAPIGTDLYVIDDEARADVLAVMDVLAASVEGGSQPAVDLAQVRAAVAELIEAGKELQAAQAHYDAIDYPGGARWDRLVAARERHAAALARVGGAA